jgi:hypothetical protein
MCSPCMCIQTHSPPPPPQTVPQYHAHAGRTNRFYREGRGKAHDNQPPQRPARHKGTCTHLACASGRTRTTHTHTHIIHTAAAPTRRHVYPPSLCIRPHPHYPHTHIIHTAAAPTLQPQHEDMCTHLACASGHTRTTPSTISYTWLLADRGL